MKITPKIVSDWALETFGISINLRSIDIVDKKTLESIEQWYRKKEVPEEFSYMSPEYYREFIKQF